MAYHFENVKLEKGMYSECGKTFSAGAGGAGPRRAATRARRMEGTGRLPAPAQALRHPREGRGQRRGGQVLLHHASPRVLFPGVHRPRGARQGMEEANILPDITASTTTRIEAMDYRSITSVPSEDDKKLKRVAEGAAIPSTHRQDAGRTWCKLHKRGRMLVASYEAIRFQKLDLFSVTLRQIGAHIRPNASGGRHQRARQRRRQQQRRQRSTGDRPLSGRAGTLTYERAGGLLGAV